MKPYPYQKKGVEDILNCFKTEQRCLYHLDTGGGKTALFSFLSKEFISTSNEGVLILAHREELIQQTVNTLFNIGVKSESIVSKKKYLNHSARVYAGMIETVNNRLNKNPYFLPKIGLVIVDEAHLMLFPKIFVHFPEAKILAVTATPGTQITEKTFRDVGGEKMEYTQKFGLHKIYHNFISGYPMANLLEDGVLVPELVFKDTQINRDELKVDNKTNDFKPENNHTKKMCVVENYEKFAKGKKTIIFTSSTKQNLSVFNDFKDRGYENVRLFDSINKEESGDRKETLLWYKETPDAVLINTGCFVAGFDETTIQAVILDLSTASLMKYKQSVGRGGRSTKKIFKDHFLLIDLGGNVDTFGKWSDPVDWEELFYYTSKCLPKKEALDNITFCKGCDMIIPATIIECPFCGFIKPIKEPVLSKETVHVAELVYPSGEKIVKYCELYSKDKNFAVNILLNQCVDLFIYTEIPKEQLDGNIRNGKFFVVMQRIINEQLLTIQNSDLNGEYKKNVITELVTKLYQMYEK